MRDVLQNPIRARSWTMSIGPRVERFSLCIVLIATNLFALDALAQQPTNDPTASAHGLTAFSSDTSNLSVTVRALADCVPESQPRLAALVCAIAQHAQHPMSPFDSKNSTPLNDFKVGLKYTLAPAAFAGARLSIGVQTLLQQDSPPNAKPLLPFSARTRFPFAALGQVSAPQSSGAGDASTPGRDSAYQWEINAGVVVPYDRSLDGTLDFYLETSRLSPRATTDAYLAPGFTWKVTRQLSLGFDALVGINTHSAGPGFLGTMAFRLH
ncbi:MAG: hypothetical protein P8X94_13170 [Woeseiaceae bacterium]